MKDALEITFNLTPEDLAHFQRHARPKQGWRSWLVAAIIVLALVFVLARPDTSRTHESRKDAQVGLVISVVGPIICVAVSLLFFRWRAKRQQASGEPPQTHHTVRIAPGGFENDDSVSVTKVQWIGFTKLASDEVLLYFMLGDMRAHIVPKRAFSSAADADAFYQTALGYWQSAKNGTPPPKPTRSPDWPPPPGR